MRPRYPSLCILGSQIFWSSNAPNITQSPVTLRTINVRSLSYNIKTTPLGMFISNTKNYRVYYIIIHIYVGVRGRWRENCFTVSTRFAFKFVTMLQLHLASCYDVYMRHKYYLRMRMHPAARVPPQYAHYCSVHTLIRLPLLTCFNL